MGLFGAQAQALEHWHIPIEKELKTLKVLNRTNQPRPLWISGPISEYLDPMEYSYEVPAFGSLEIPLIDFLSFPWIHLKAQESGTFQIQILTSFENSVLINSGPSLRWKSRARPQSEAVILNLAPFNQSVTISQDGQKIESISLPAFGKARVSLEHYASASMITFEGEARIAGALLSPQESKSFIPDPSMVKLSASDNLEAHYFKLTNKGNRQSYIVRISDPKLITQAQLQIRSPNQALPRILIGQIDYGNGGFNRDFSEVRSTPWSWNVKNVIRFSELASQDCDGSPEMLEEVLKPWKENSGVICFWNYRITEELNLDQITAGRRSMPLVPLFPLVTDDFTRPEFGKELFPW